MLEMKEVGVLSEVMPAFSREPKVTKTYVQVSGGAAAAERAEGSAAAVGLRAQQQQ